MNTKMKYPQDKKELDEFYKEWYEENKDNLMETWNRTDVYDFASKYAEKRLFLANVVGQSEQLKALEDLKDFAYENCQPHNSDRLAEIMERLLLPTLRLRNVAL